MAHSSSTIVPHRRRREQRTDYRQRLKLLRSGLPRFVVRRQSGSIVCQFVLHDPKGDKTVVTVNRAHLAAAGWKGHCGNLPAAYLSGYLAGHRAHKAKVTRAIADFGLHHFTKGSALAAAVKGAVDAGIDIPHDPEALPSQDRIEGKHIAAYAKNTKSVGKDLPSHFAEVKAKLKA